MTSVDQLPNQDSASWHGNLKLVFARRQEATRVIQTQVQAPLKVQRPFYTEGPEVCHSAILHTAGGIVGGDRLSLDFHLGDRAHALITTAAAGKVYRSQGLEAQQTINIQIAPGACCEWLPQETIIFNGANYRQDLRVELAPGATWAGWEITRFGRTARGERFEQGHWRSRTEVWQQNHPLWIDSQFLQGGSPMLDHPHGLAGYPVVGSLAWVGDSVSSDKVAQARQLWSTATRRGEAGVTRLSQGMLCRYRGPDTWEARSWFMEVWNLLRSAFLGRAARPPRVWI